MFFRFLILSVLFFLSACQYLPQRQGEPADVKDATIDAKINPKNQQQSVIETLPLMNNAVRSLYNQALKSYKNNLFPQAIASLERAFGIQPNAPQVSQLLAEISLYQGEYIQAHYWATIATKNGPSKGKTCEKSWRILALTSEKLGYFAYQNQALENKLDCLVTPQNRY